MKKHIIEYADYEDADSGRIYDASRVIEKNGGKVCGSRANEDDGVAYIAFVCTDENLPKILNGVKEDGWSQYI